LGIVVLVCFFLRVALMIKLRSYDIPAAFDHWNFGYEAGRIARSLALGQGFSSPLIEPSGPTAFLPPGYPLVLSGIFRLFGIYTARSAIAAYLLNCIFSSLTCIMLYHLGTRIFNRATGLLAAACLAVYPPSIWHAVSTIWDTTLLTFALVGLVAWLYGLPPRASALHLIATGLMMGFIALLNPAPLTFYPVALFILWRQQRAKGSSGYREAALVAGIFLLVYLPWPARNALALGSFSPRSNGGLVLRLGNDAAAWRAGGGGWDRGIYPSESPRENRLFHQMGEVAYDRYCTGVAMDYIRTHPGRFAVLTLRRIQAWWLGERVEWAGNFKVAFGLATLKRLVWVLPLPFAIAGCFIAWRKRLRIGILLALLAIYPLAYYFTLVEERYRFPIEPFLLLTGSYGIMQLRITRAKKAPKPAEE
jgi:4-amino-4-deoxy-L-arabinose transferase-like glycosyltransferase